MPMAMKKSRESLRERRLRERAEALLKKSPAAVFEAPAGRVVDLVHDLRVHQAELEMQNEELRRLQLELENSRDRFALLYDLAPVGYLTLDTEGVIHEANATAERLLGVERRALLKKRLSRFVTANSQDDLYLHCQKVFTSTGKQTCDLRMCRPGGAEFSGHLESIVETAVPKQPPLCLVALSDVTERMQAEAERARLAAIVQFSEDGIVSRDLDDIITTWNAGAERMFGYTASEIVGRSFGLLLPPERRNELRQIGQSIRHTEFVALFDTERVDKDGRRIAVSCRNSPLKDASGKLIGIAAIMRDVSAQKEIEQALRQREAELADFFNESPLGLLWVEMDGRIGRVNRALLDMLGRASEEVLGHHISEFHTEAETAQEALERLAKNKTLANHHARLWHKEGTIRHALIDANGLWVGGELVHSRWFVRDITVRKRLEREILESSEREQQRIGHDLHDGLGQHLHGLSFLSALLEKSLKEDRSPHVKEVARLNKYLKEALKLARGLARGLMPVESDPQGLMLALRELARRTRGLYRVDCRFQCLRPVLIRRQIAASHLYRIAQEAVNNAIKHGKPTRLRIHLSASPQHIILGVRDNGAGICLTGKPCKGMGLHIMQYRADAIYGSLVVRPHPEGGTEVLCTVQRQALAAPERSDGKEKR